MQEKKFIYAVIENKPEYPQVLSAYGIDSAALEMICHRDMVAVVSAIDANRFDPALPAAEERLNADLLKYQQVNSFLLDMSGKHGMLPLKFGFIATDSHDVVAVLDRAYLVLRALLDRLRGQVELVVQASWDISRIIPQIARENPELIGTDTMQTGKRLFEAAEARKKGFMESIHRQLSPLSRDSSDGSRKTEGMILNRSYLVEKTQEAAFDAAMNALGDEFDAILSFRYIGPLPAYSFVNIELNQGNFALLDRSRRIMQLPETATWRQIKAAYRQLLLANHPDRNPGDPQAEQRCKDVVEAYDIVSAYCQSFQDFAVHGNDREYGFTRDDVEKVFIVDTKGALLARENYSCI